MASDVCRICLAGNIKMLFIANTQLQVNYEKLTSNQWSKDNRPSTICFVCHALLKRCDQFREMSKQSEEVFAQFFDSGFEITKDTVPILHKRNLQKLLVTPVKILTIGISKDSTTSEKGITLNYQTPSINQRKPQKMLRTPIRRLTIGTNISSREEITQKNELQTKSTQTKPNLQKMLRTPITALTIGTITTKNELQSKSTQTKSKGQTMLVTPIETMSIDAFSSEGTKVKEDITVQETPVIKQEKCCSTEADPFTPEENNAVNNTVEYSFKDITTGSGEPLVVIPAGNEIFEKDINRNTDKNTDKNRNKLESPQYFDKNDRTSSEKSDVRKSISCFTLRFQLHNKNTLKTQNDKTSAQSDKTNAQSDKTNAQSDKTNAQSDKTNAQSNKKRSYPFDISGSTPEKLYKMPYPSNYCDESLKSFSHLKNHLIIHVGDDIDNYYTCDDCKMKFNRKSYLTQHKRTHTQNRSFPCTSCPKKFTCMKNLNQHLKIHSEEIPYVCAICKKGFKQISNLDQHYRTHTNENPFSCDDCGKRFKQQSNLLQHVRVHNGDKPFSCDECSKRFSQISNLNQHKRIHTGVKPFSCSKCDKTFRQKSNLLQHERVHNARDK